MWHSKVSRQTFPADFIGVALVESCKLFTGWSEGIDLLRKSSLIFNREIECVRRHQLRKRFGQVSGKQSPLHSLGALRNHTIRQDIHDPISHFVILSGTSQ